MYPLTRNYYENNSLRLIFCNFGAILCSKILRERRDFFKELRVRFVIFQKKSKNNFSQVIFLCQRGYLPFSTSSLVLSDIRHQVGCSLTPPSSSPCVCLRDVQRLSESNNACHGAAVMQIFLWACSSPFASQAAWYRMENGKLGNARLFTKFLFTIFAPINPPPSQPAK